MPENQLRCAIYTRKSTEGTHNSKMTSCESQRQACEQWAAKRPDLFVLPMRYDDLGYSGGNTERPAYQKLLADIHLGSLDAVIVYDFDRLSRSTRDFPIIQELLNDKGIKTFSVTENYDGMSESYRELLLGIKMQIAQFQRTDAAARVKQKLTAMAEKGMHVSGSPVIGYNIVNKGWVSNPGEAQQALDQFLIYIKTKSLSATVREMNARGYRTKQWTTPKGIVKGGRLYSKSTLHYNLRNPVYIGMMRYDGKIYQGKQPGIIPKEVFDEAQGILESNNERHDSLLQGNSDLWLKGKLTCAICGSSMTPTWTTGKGDRKYFYYECTKSRTLGKNLCPVRRVPAAGIHQALLDRMNFLGDHPPLVRECLKAAQKEIEGNLSGFETELERVRRELTKVERQGQRLAESIAEGIIGKDSSFIRQKLDEIERRKNELLAQKAKLESEAKAQAAPLPAFTDFQSTLSQFSTVMTAVTINERKELADLLIRQVSYDEANATITASLYALPELPDVTFQAGFRKASKSAERVGFEPTEALTPREFSRLVP